MPMYHTCATNTMHSKKNWANRLVRNIRHFKACGYNVCLGGDMNATYPVPGKTGGNQEAKLGRYLYAELDNVGMRPLLKNEITYQSFSDSGVPKRTAIDKVWLSEGLDGTCKTLQYTEMNTDHAPMLARICVSGVVAKVKPHKIRRRKFPKKGTELYAKQAENLSNDKRLKEYIDGLTTLRQEKSQVDYSAEITELHQKFEKRLYEVLDETAPYEETNVVHKRKTYAKLAHISREMDIAVEKHTKTCEREDRKNAIKLGKEMRSGME